MNKTKVTVIRKPGRPINQPQSFKLPNSFKLSKNPKCTVCGAKVDFLVDRPCGFCSQPKPEIGMGVTFGCWTDRMVGTIVAVSKSGKQITVQDDTATRTDKNGMSENQQYEYTRNPKGGLRVFKVTTRKGMKAWRGDGFIAAIGFRRAYHDFSF